MKTPMLTAWTLACPACNSRDVEVRQVGHMVSTLLLICGWCDRTSNFVGPTIESEVMKP